MGGFIAWTKFLSKSGPSTDMFLENIFLLFRFAAMKLCEIFIVLQHSLFILANQWRLMLECREILSLENTFRVITYSSFTLRWLAILFPLGISYILLIYFELFIILEVRLLLHRTEGLDLVATLFVFFFFNFQGFDVFPFIVIDWNASSSTVGNDFKFVQSSSA